MRSLSPLSLLQDYMVPIIIDLVMTAVFIAACLRPFSVSRNVLFYITEATALAYKLGFLIILLRVM